LRRSSRIIGVSLSNADVAKIVELRPSRPRCHRLLSDRPQLPGVIAWLDEATVNEPAWCRKFTQHCLGIVGAGLVEQPRKEFASLTRSVLASFEAQEVVPIRFSEVLFDQRQDRALLVFEVAEHAGREIHHRSLTVESTGKRVIDGDEGRRYAGVLAWHVVDLCPCGHADDSRTQNRPQIIVLCSMMRLDLPAQQHPSFLDGRRDAVHTPQRTDRMLKAVEIATHGGVHREHETDIRPTGGSLTLHCPPVSCGKGDSNT
jgi:hypothetical protein